MRKIQAVIALPVLAASLFIGAGASASTDWGTLNGTNVDFTGLGTTTFNGITETNDEFPLADAPLFGAPSVAGNSLQFFPGGFLAQASGGAIDNTGAQLQVVLDAIGLFTIDTVNITELGDTTLGVVGGPGTATMVSVGGALTITHALILGVEQALPTSVKICFPGPAIPGCDAVAAVSYSPSQFFLLPGDLGTKNWSAQLSIDVASVVPNATRAILSLDNDLSAFSEAGTTAKIQKKVVDGPSVIIEVIPEPGTFALVCGGLLALGVRARNGRA